MKSNNYYINFERELFFAQYSPSDDKFRLVFKNAGTQALFQNISRSKRWKEIASYHKEDSISQSIYLHIRGCWHLSHRSSPSVEELTELVNKVDRALYTRIYKKGEDDEV